MNKKYLGLALAGALFASAVAFTAAGNAEATTSFKDVPTKHWAYKDIQKATSLNIVSGYGGGEFKPEASVTRAEFAAFLARAIDSSERVTEPFSDISEEHWAKDNIEEGIALGFIDPAEYGSGKFNPDQKMTRIEIARWMSKGLTEANPDYEAIAEEMRASSLTLLPVTEHLKGEIPKNDVGHVGVMIGTGLMVGDTNGSFKPSGNTTRAEVASVILRFLDVSKKDEASFTALNELREVAVTGTNITSITDYSAVEGKSFKNIIGKSRTYKYEGTGYLNRMIVVDTRHSKPKGIYADMFVDIKRVTQFYSAYMEVSFKAAKTTNYDKMANSVNNAYYAPMTLDAGKTTKYGYKSPAWDKNEIVSTTYFKPGKVTTIWGSIALDAIKGSRAWTTSDDGTSFMYMIN